MSVAQRSFAEAIEHRLRRSWPKATVEYAGAVWFVYRSDPTMPSQKMRREELSRKAASVAAAGRKDGEPK